MSKFCLDGCLKVGSFGWPEILIFSTLPTPPNRIYPYNEISNLPIQFIAMPPPPIYYKEWTKCSERDKTKVFNGSLQRMTSRSARQCKFHISTIKALLVMGAKPLLFALLLIFSIMIHLPPLSFHTNNLNNN